MGTFVYQVFFNLVLRVKFLLFDLKNRFDIKSLKFTEQEDEEGIKVSTRTGIIAKIYQSMLN